MWYENHVKIPTGKDPATFFNFGLEVGFKDAYINNINTVSTLELLEPLSPYALHNLIELNDSPEVSFNFSR